MTTRNRFNYLSIGFKHVMLLCIWFESGYIRLLHTPEFGVSRMYSIEWFDDDDDELYVYYSNEFTGIPEINIFCINSKPLLTIYCEFICEFIGS